MWKSSQYRLLVARRSNAIHGIGTVSQMMQLMLPLALYVSLSHRAQQAWQVIQQEARKFVSVLTSLATLMRLVPLRVDRSLLAYLLTHGDEPFPRSCQLCEFFFFCDHPTVRRYITCVVKKNFVK
jgi:hypothetical protein